MPRLALVTPWPPEQTGVAGYNACLAAALCERVELDVVVAGGESDYAPAPRGAWQVVAASPGGLDRYDRVLYCMGNSRFHEHVYELLLESPDAVLFHDVQLTGFYNWRSATMRPEDPERDYEANLHSMYPGLLDEDGGLAEPARWPELAARGVRMTREIQDLATQCFTHSHAALQMLLADRDGPIGSRPASRLPFAMPALRAERSAPADPLAAPTVISVGVVTEIKGILRLLDAFALLAREQREARLVVAGPVEDIEHWRALARERAPGAAIEFTGYLAASAYSSLLACADVAVQLRLLDTGEASWAIGDCLAAGLPTIVSDLGWAGELPVGVVSHVPLDATPDLIAARIAELLRDRSLRRSLGASAREYARELSFERAADAYLRTLGLD